MSQVISIPTMNKKNDIRLPPITSLKGETSTPYGQQQQASPNQPTPPPPPHPHPQLQPHEQQLPQQQVFPPGQIPSQSYYHEVSDNRYAGPIPTSSTIPYSYSSPHLQPGVKLPAFQDICKSLPPRELPTPQQPAGPRNSVHSPKTVGAAISVIPQQATGYASPRQSPTLTHQPGLPVHGQYVSYHQQPPSRTSLEGTRSPKEGRLSSPNPTAYTHYQYPQYHYPTDQQQGQTVTQIPYMTQSPSIYFDPIQGQQQQQPPPPPPPPPGYFIQQQHPVPSQPQPFYQQQQSSHQFPPQQQQQQQQSHELQSYYTAGMSPSSLISQGHPHPGLMIQHQGPPSQQQQQPPIQRSQSMHHHHLGGHAVQQQQHQHQQHQQHHHQQHQQQQQASPQQQQLSTSRSFMAKSSSAWAPEDDKLLRMLKEEKKLGWREIASYFPNRTLNACQFRWRRIVIGVAGLNQQTSSTTTTLPSTPGKRSHSDSAVSQPEPKKTSISYGDSDRESTGNNREKDLEDRLRKVNEKLLASTSVAKSESESDNDDDEEEQEEEEEDDEDNEDEDEDYKDEKGESPNKKTTIVEKETTETDKLSENETVTSTSITRSTATTTTTATKVDNDDESVVVESSKKSTKAPDSVSPSKSNINRLLN
ncbi:hypothetical protein CANARDRAFT_25699 [[Candida] arabinofermentans NRRL YB-2248]|uniref:Myb-like domain-containing protein n=1 Tax=[Candida] arabinofermentans NRRL YB-2248 TaxID=983967 RepID=A0A1E4ST78_9ASCO|nr:hypothetical protein CANARDRAFT_25699 [[Candida] arabinofermentans NRRL YB-2248]